MADIKKIIEKETVVNIFPKLAAYAMTFIRAARTREDPMTVAIPVFGAELHLKIEI